MATKTPAEDLLGDKPEKVGKTEDLFGDKPNDKPADAKKDAAPAKKTESKAPAKKTESKATPAKKDAKTAKAEGRAALKDWIKGKPKDKPEPAAKKAAPAKAKSMSKAATDRAERGTGEKYFPADGEEYKALRSKLMPLKSPALTTELAEKFGTETWKVRRACVFLIEERGKGKLKKEKGQRALTFHP